MNNFKNNIGWILQEKYGGKLTVKAKEDIERLKKGEPLDYIIGFTDFLGCKIDLSKKPLIPRVETEFWVGEVIEEIKNNYPLQTTNYKLRILDIFSGSGCVGLAVLRHLSYAKVIFADSQENCLKQIKINCDLNKIPKSRYQIVQSDVFSNIKGKCDFIFANPPYIPTKNTKKVQVSVLQYEPKEALFGGEDGMHYIKKFLTDAKNFLNPNGKIYMEFDSIQKSKIEKLLKEYQYKSWQFNKDQYGKWRYLFAE